MQLKENLFFFLEKSLYEELSFSKNMYVLITNNNKRKNKIHI